MEKVKRDEKKRFSLQLPVIILDRLEDDSIKYGIPKSSIIQNAILFYYRSADRSVSK